MIDLSRAALASAKEFLERHEIPVRGITVAFDALGVIAGGAVLLAIGPELAAGALGAAAFSALGGAGRLWLACIADHRWSDVGLRSHRRRSQAEVA